ncbi:MAG: hypothetical protein ABWZ25_08215 [Chitinophagaceae bacterium]
MRQAGKDRSRNENLRADNDYMKMKLMLERGAKFGVVGPDKILPPEIENLFLRQVIEFESLNDTRAFIRVGDKIGRPARFLPADQIPEEEIGRFCRDLLEFLNDHQITIGVCSPNVSHRELYRFVTEELFELNISNVDMPGLVHGFVYDEFHPDPLYDNPRSVISGCIEPIFCIKPIGSMHFYRRFDLRLNDHYPLGQQEFMNLVNHFKSGYEELDELYIGEVGCQVEGVLSSVTGNFKVHTVKGGNSTWLEGQWKVELVEHPVTGVWDIISVQIDQIRF